MTTTPETLKGVPRHEGNSTYTPRADLNSVSDWLVDNAHSSWPTYSTLPAVDNWTGRTYWVEDANASFVWDGAQWVPLSPQFAYYHGAVTPASGANGDIPSTQSSVTPGLLTLGTNAIIVGVSGWYHVEGSVAWDNNNNGARVMEVTADGAPMTYRVAARATANSTNANTISGKRYFAAGTVLRLRVNQDSGIALTATGALSVEFVSLGAAPA